MRTISQIIGGSQPLLPLEYEVQDCFPELLTDMHRDSTAIETRERPVNKKEEEEEKKAVKRGRAGDERRKGA